MTNSKSTKRSLLTSSISLMLCFAMLLGTTFAWFTDSAVSASNVIKSGNLDIDVQYTLGDEDTEGNLIWKPLDNKAADLFQKGLWEPGHTEVVALRIENKGSLALKYTANMNIVEEKIGKTKDGKDIVLSDILTVASKKSDNVADVTTAFVGENALTYDKTTSFTTDFLGTKDSDIIEKDKVQYVIIKVDMAETVGNEANHNGINIPEIYFGVNVLATQFTYENDSFGNEYDENSEYPKGAEYYVVSADKLIESIDKAEQGQTISLMNDIKISPANMSNAYGTTGINIKKGQTLDGNGNTLDIKGAGGTWDSGINTTGGTIKNIKVTGSFRGIFINHNSTHSEPVILENVIIDGTTYTISCDQGKNQNLFATNSTFNGWTSYASTIGTVKFTDCKFGKGNGYAFCRPYAPTDFVGCDFEAGYEMDPRAAVTFENCTIGGVELTVENLSTLVTSNIENATVK